MTAPKNWLLPGARQELLEKHHAVDAAPDYEAAQHHMGVFFEAAHEAVPQLLDEIERLERELQLRLDEWQQATQEWRAERDALKAEVENLKWEVKSLRQCLSDNDLRPDE